MVRRTVECLVVSAIVLLASAFLWVAFWRDAPASEATPRLPAKALDLRPETTRGDRHALVGIVVFSDFQCPFCRRFVQQTLRELERDYVSSGKLLVAFRHLPLTALHARASAAAEAAECAAQQGLFWAMHDRLFDGPADLADASIAQKAREAGLNMELFRACVTGGLGRRSVESEIAFATSLGVSSTPTLMIGSVADGRHLMVKQVLLGPQEVGLLRELLFSKGRWSRNGEHDEPARNGPVGVVPATVTR